jgi:DNA repair photolyase
LNPKRYDTLTAKQALNRVKLPRMPFDWSLNPYRGCAHGCSFCYARAFQSFLGRGADDEFQRHISVKANAAEALERQLTAQARKVGGDLNLLARRIGPVAVGTATDPYQPIEGKAEITRQCLQVLQAYRITVSITTRSPLILRDLDLLKEMPGLTVNISLNTVDAALTRKLEPGSPLPMKRLEALRKLSESGIHAGVFAAPILPALTDSYAALDALFAAARDSGARFVMTSLLRLTPDVKAWFFRTLQEQVPERLNAYRALYRGTYAPEGYAEAIGRRIDRLRRKYGMPAAAPAPREESEPAAPEAVQLTLPF